MTAVWFLAISEAGFGSFELVDENHTPHGKVQLINGDAYEAMVDGRYYNGRTPEGRERFELMLAGFGGMGASNRGHASDPYDQKDVRTGNG